MFVKRCQLFKNFLNLSKTLQLDGRMAFLVPRDFLHFNIMHVRPREREEKKNKSPHFPLRRINLNLDDNLLRFYQEIKQVWESSYVARIQWENKRGWKYILCMCQDLENSFKMVEISLYKE